MSHQPYIAAVSPSLQFGPASHLDRLLFVRALWPDRAGHHKVRGSAADGAGAHLWRAGGEWGQRSMLVMRKRANEKRERTFLSDGWMKKGRCECILIVLTLDTVRYPGGGEVRDSRQNGSHRGVQVGSAVGPPAANAREAERVVAGEQPEAPVSRVGLGQDSLQADPTLHLRGGGVAQGLGQGRGDADTRRYRGPWYCRH